MLRYSGWCCLLLLAASTVQAAEPAKPAEPVLKTVLELWDAAYLDGNRSGYVYSIVREFERDGQKLYHTAVTVHLIMKRFEETVEQRMEKGTVETADGKVVSVTMKQYLGKKQQLVLTGSVKGNALHIKVTGEKELEKQIPWNDQVIGMYREYQLCKDKAVKPGDQFSYQHYEPFISSVVTVRASVKDYEEVDIGQGKQKLLRVEMMPDKIEQVQMPRMDAWLNAELTPVRTQIEMPGMGKMTQVRTTREVALSPISNLKDINQPIVVQRRVTRPHDTRTMVYRITIPQDDDPGTAFARDDRQEVKNLKGKMFDLHVAALRQPKAMNQPVQPVGEEYLKSNYFINSADARVQDLARKAVGTETDPWRKAQRIEKWVRTNMKILNFSEAMATADHVAKTLEGDCTEFAMLTAAMCRAAQVPSRTAVGLVYVDGMQPMLAYHMWTEVWAQGQWLAIDATLGRGSVGAAHVKIADHSWQEKVNGQWQDVRSLKPLLPVMRVLLGKPAIEVVEVTTGE